MSFTSKVSGKYKIESYKLDENGKEIEGSRRIAAEWFPNLITDIGLERMAEYSDYLTWCSIGQGITPADVTDTSLANIYTSTSLISQNDYGVNTIDNFAWVRNTYTFSPPTNTITITEVGVGWSNAQGSLFSRAVIPYPINISQGETFDVVYEFKVYPKVLDSTGSVTFGGTGGGTYNWTMRLCNFSSWVINQTGTSMNSISELAYAYNGDISDINSYPNSTETDSPTTYTALTYIQDSKRCEFTTEFSFDNGNINGIKSLSLPMGIGIYQIGFDTAIPKNINNTLIITFFHTWDRT